MGQATSSYNTSCGPSHNQKPMGHNAYLSEQL